MSQGAGLANAESREPNAPYKWACYFTVGRFNEYFRDV